MFLTSHASISDVLIEAGALHTANMVFYSPKGPHIVKTVRT